MNVYSLLAANSVIFASKKENFFGKIQIIERFYYCFSSSHRRIHVMEVQVKEVKLNRISLQNVVATRCVSTYRKFK